MRLVPERSAGRWPDFYLVGAPKAGTTSLYTYLGQHPSIFLPPRKELRYFGSDLKVVKRHRFSEADFLSEYAAARPEQLCGNAYVWYLFSRLAASEIHAVRPDARIVVMLRNPVDALFALHSEFVYDGNEDIVQFEQALAAEPERCAGRRIPPEAHFAAGLCYHATVAYSEQLQRFLDWFRRDALHVILFDDFVLDPAATYAATVEFLGLRRHPIGTLDRLNPNKRARSALIRNLLAAPSPRVRRMVRSAVPRPVRRAVYRQAVALNTRHADREPLSPELRHRLAAELEPEVARVEALLGRPIPAWRTMG